MKNYKLRRGNISLDKLPSFSWDRFETVINTIPNNLLSRTKLSKIEVLQLNCFYCLLALTCCRPSELLELRVGDIKIVNYKEKDFAIVSLQNLKYKRYFRKVIDGKKLIIKRNTRDNMAVKNIPINLDNQENKFLIKPFFIYLQMVSDKPTLKMFAGMNKFKVWYYFARATSEQGSKKQMDTGLNLYGIKHIAVQHLVVDKNIDQRTMERIVGHRDSNSLKFYYNLQTKDIIKQILERGA